MSAAVPRSPLPVAEAISVNEVKEDLQKELLPPVPICMCLVWSGPLHVSLCREWLVEIRSCEIVRTRVRVRACVCERARACVCKWTDGRTDGWMDGGWPLR